LALIVAFIYVARLAITMVLIAAAPLALMFHALPMTDGIARLWWRGITGMLAIQVCQSLVLVSALQVLFADTKDEGPFHGVPTTKQDLIDVLLVICLLWVMIRIPSWVARTIWRSAQPRMLGQLVRSFLVYRTVGAAFSTVGRAVRGGRATHTSKHRGGPGRVVRVPVLGRAGGSREAALATALVAPLAIPGHVILAVARRRPTGTAVTNRSGATAAITDGITQVPSTGIETSVHVQSTDATTGLPAQDRTPHSRRRRTQHRPSESRMPSQALGLLQTVVGGRGRFHQHSAAPDPHGMWCCGLTGRGAGEEAGDDHAGRRAAGRQDPC